MILTSVLKRSQLGVIQRMNRDKEVVRMKNEILVSSF